MKILLIFLFLVFPFSYAAANDCLNSITIGSWNTKHLGRKSFDYDNAVKLIKNFDVVALQEVNTNDSGKLALDTLRKKLAQDTGNRWCAAISKRPSDSKELYAYLWKDEKLALIENEKRVDHCKDSAHDVPLLDKFHDKIVREPAMATFFSKTEKITFHYATVHLVPTNKQPSREVPFLFKSLPSTNIPTVVAGDFNLSSSHTAFMPFKKDGWKNILPDNTKTSLKMKTRNLNAAYDNFWTKNFPTTCSSSYNVKNIYEIFTKLPGKHIYYKISDHAPIMMNYIEKTGRSIASEKGTQR